MMTTDEIRGSESHANACEKFRGKAVKIRGFMIDSARCLESRDYYRRLIEFCAVRGVNAIFWHFTDDQGCSLRFDSMPEIASPHAYSKAEMRELIDFARNLGITLVPELETLGHSRYITGLPPYRHLLESDEDFTAICPLAPETRAIMARLLKEVAEVFDSPWIHVGLDEVKFGEHPLTRKALETRSKEDIFAEYALFIHGVVRGLGRRMILWGNRVTMESGLVTLLPQECILANWEYTEAVAPDQTQYFLDQGLDVILCPALISHGQQLLPGSQLGISNVRSMAGHLTLKGKGEIAGIITTVWTGTRYFHGAQWWGFHLSAEIMRSGPEADARAAARDFLRKFYGFAREVRAAEDALLACLDLAPVRADYLAVLRLNRLDEIDAAGCKEKGMAWRAIHAGLAASQGLVLRNGAAFETFLFTTEFLVHLYERAAALKTSNPSERAKALSKNLRVGNALRARMLSIWDEERFADDPRKVRATLSFDETEFVILGFQASLDRCAALLEKARAAERGESPKWPGGLVSPPPSRKPGALSTSAFTLVELLTVIGVIAILAALVMAVLPNAKQMANRSASVSNIRQIAMGINAYANENNDYFPLGYFYQPPSPGVAYLGELSYATEVMPYLGGSSCTALYVSPTSAIMPVKTPPPGSMAMTYSVHNLLCPDTSNGAKQVKRTLVVRPTQVILVADGSQSPSSTYSRATFENPTMSYGMQNDFTELIPVGPDADTAAGAGWMRYRSIGSVTVAMVDGHADNLKKGTVTYGNIIPDR